MSNFVVVNKDLSAKPHAPDSADAKAVSQEQRALAEVRGASLPGLAHPFLHVSHSQDLKKELIAIGANQSPFECPVCLCECPPLQGLRLRCGHSTCLECLSAFAKESINQRQPMRCATMDCGMQVSSADARLVLSEAEWRAYISIEELAIRNDFEGIFNCMTPDCKNSVFVDGLNDTNVSKKDAKCGSKRHVSAVDSRWRCTLCRADWCVRCKTKWHPNKGCFENKQQSNAELDNKMAPLVASGHCFRCR